MTAVAADRQSRRGWLALVLAAAVFLAAPLVQALPQAGLPMAPDCEHCQTDWSADDCRAEAPGGGESLGVPGESRRSPSPLAADTPDPGIAGGPAGAMPGLRAGSDPPASSRARHLIFSRFLE